MASDAPAEKRQKTEESAPAEEKPAADVEKPAADAEKPAADAEKPAADAEKPAADAEKPAADVVMEEPKAEDAAAAAAAAEEAAKAKAAAEAPKVPEPPKELELDAETIPAKSVNKDGVAFLVKDTTLNVLTSGNGNVLMTMNEGGIQHFYAGTRANAGITGGRYLFEVKVLEFVNVIDSGVQGQGGSRLSKNSLRLGFSTAGSSLVLGATADGICFDSDGQILHNKTKLAGCQKFGRSHSVLGVLLNLEEKHENYGTISLFQDGKRLTQPQALPEALKGKMLFPHISFKNTSLHAHFGPVPLAPLPFTCHMVTEADKAHLKVSKPPAAPSDGRYELICPVGLPDEGTFDWLDMYLEKHPHLTELSGRMILDWADQSGIDRRRKQKVSNDLPDLDFEHVKKSVYAIAPLQSRSYVVMEVKSNLMKDERTELLSRFSSTTFKRKAVVTVGEPTTDFKKRTQKLVLEKKQEASDKVFELERLEAQRARLAAKRQKEIEKTKKAAEKAARKAAREAAKKNAEEKKAAEGDNKDGEEKKAAEGDNKDGEEKKEDEKMEEAKAEEPESEEEKEAEELDEPEDDKKEPPKVELSDEDKKLNFCQHEVKDLTPPVLSTTFAKYSLPAKEEGFDDVEFAWSKGKKCEEYMKNWILERKLTLRVEDIKPSEWFEKKHKEFQHTMQQWRSKESEYESRLQRKRAEKVRKAQLKAAKAAKKAAEQAAKEKAEAEKAAAAANGELDKKEGEDGEAKPMDVDKEKKDGEEKKEDAGEKKEEEKKEESEDEKEEEDEVDDETATDFANLDVFGVEDIADVGGRGMPLFKAFRSEDWAMLALRFELHLLVQAFRKDVDDPDRLGIHTDHFSFYYNRYYKKPMHMKDYGVESVRDLVGLVNDAVFVSDKNVLGSHLHEEMETLFVFVKLTEEARRHRLLRIDLGEDAALKLNMTSLQQAGRRHEQGKIQRPNLAMMKGGKGFQMPGKGMMKGPLGFQQMAMVGMQGKGMQGDFKGGWGKGGDFKGGVRPPMQALQQGGKEGWGKDAQKGFQAKGDSKGDGSQGKGDGFQAKGIVTPPPAPAAQKGGDSGGKGYDKGGDKGGYGKGGYDSGKSYDKGNSSKGYDSGKGYDKGGYGKDKGGQGKYGYQPYGKGGGKDDSSKGYSKGGYDSGKGYDKGKSSYDKGGYGKGSYDKGGYSKGGNDKGWSKGGGKY